ncbi:chaplin [Streptomyces sp. ISL-100]|uniref:chaplin n=1 Tax=Streptomyces sp. ISL-100 TaxID=2819173 RepID=UPI001BE5A6F7|nr:chaplin [Streptomyces sp. ISL-100]MBT2401845.1 chaplin [Streptomyces sp. ISL-100]
MKWANRNGVFAVAAASGVMAMALPVSSALAADGASAGATTAGSPGVLSGNAIQIPVDVPVNICGNTVNVVGLLNPAAGNTCANKGGAAKTGGSKAGGSKNRGGSAASGGASAQGLTADSPGLISGNGIQLPVDLPVNVSGNSVNVVGLGNPAFGNKSVNGPGDQPRQHSKDPAPKPPASKPRAPQPSNDPAPKPRASKPPALVPSQPGPHTPDAAAPMLADTGGDLTAPAVAAGAALLAGAVLYRRFRPVRTR